MQPLVQGSIFSSLANHRCCQTLYGQTITAQSYTANKGTIKHSHTRLQATLIFQQSEQLATSLLHNRTIHVKSTFEGSGDSLQLEHLSKGLT